jgi:ABC-type dipeptide/oligopeptide/nickel transport system permease component
MSGALAGFALRRLGLALLVALVASALAFGLLRASGDMAVALAGEGARAEDIDRIRLAYELDRPWLAQYSSWALRMLRGDFGESLFFKTSVRELVIAKLPVTVALAISSLAFALLLSVPLAVASAVAPNGWIDRLALTITALVQAVPSFFLALVLIVVFGVWARALPVSGTESWLHFVLPTVALGSYVAPAFMRLARSGMVEVLGADYIRTARAKGLSRRAVVVKHALPNVLAPIVSLAAVQLGLLLGGSVVIETVFALDGIGYLAYESITHKDAPVVQAIVALLSLAYVLLTVVADVVNAWLDPRLRARS